MKITISKSQWESMGKKAGWTKQAMLTHILYTIMEQGDNGLNISDMDPDELKDARQYEKTGVMIQKDGKYFINKEHKPDFEKSKKYVEDLMGDKVSKRRFIKVTFNDGDVVQTSINGTKKAIEDYYMKQDFTKQDESGKHRGVKVEFLS